MTRANKQLITLPVYFSLLLIYLEVVFHIYEFGSLTGACIFLLLFSIMAGVFLSAVTELLPEKGAYILTVFLTFFFACFFCRAGL